MRIRKRRASPASLDCDGPLKRIGPSLRCSPPPTAPSSPLGAPRGVQSLQTTSPLQRLLKVGDTSGFLLSVFPALTFTTSLGHASMHEDAVSSPLLQPDACPFLQGDIQSGDPVLVSPWYVSLRYRFLHTWRDLPVCYTVLSIQRVEVNSNYGKMTSAVVTIHTNTTVKRLGLLA